VALGFLVPPLALSYWHADTYGVWTLATSLVAYLSASGFGIETASSVLLAKVKHGNDKDRIFARAALLLAASSLGFCLVLTVVGVYVPRWIELFGKIPADIVEDSRTAIAIFAFAFLINYPFAVVGSGLVGYQRQFIDNIFKMANSLGALLTLFLVISINGNLQSFALFQGIFSLCVNIARTSVYLTIKQKSKAMSDFGIDRLPMSETGAKVILSSGLRYFFYGLAVLLVLNIDSFLIANFINLSSVTSYSITAKLYFMLNTLVTAILASLAPIISREFGEKKIAWVSDMYRLLTKAALVLGGLISLGGAFFFDDFMIHLWVGKAGSAGSAVILALGFYCYLSIVTNVSNIFLIQCNLTKGFAFLGWSEAVLHVVLVWCLLPVFGVLGAALGQLLAMSLSQCWRSPYILKRNSGEAISFDVKLFARFTAVLVVPGLVLSALCSLFVAELLSRVLLGVLILFVYFVGAYYVIFRGIQITEVIESFRVQFRRL